MSIDHVLLTRFNLPTPGPESFVRAQEGWLRNRIELFLRHTVPTVRAQTVQDFSWIIYFDLESPAWLIERLTPLINDGVFIALYRNEVGWRDVLHDVRAVTGGRGSILLTTNLDNDDAIAIDFVERLQAVARRQTGSALYLRTGLIMQGGHLYLRDDSENAFCSVGESWDAPVTAWRDWHTHLSNHLPVVSKAGPPAWLQVVHGQNVSNRVRGRIVDPARYRALFPGQFDDLPSPMILVRGFDQIVRRPLREGKEAARRVGKSVILRVWGKDGLDRLKSAIHGR